MFFKKNKEIDISVPEHIGIIMDGNGRWAKKRAMPRSFGHIEGAKTFRKIVKSCEQLGVKYLTVYAFSTENWSRPKSEVEAIMKLFEDYLEDALENFKNENIKVQFIGDRTLLSQRLKTKMNEAEDETKNKYGMTLNIAINYGGRQEIVHAFKCIYEEMKNNNLKIDDLNEDVISNYLYTKNQPDVDLIIRPSGELRISNFLLWQSAYGELWFDDILWPDFKEQDLLRAITDYSKRKRRFGGLK